MAILICHFNLKTSLFTISLLFTPSTSVSQYLPEQFDQCQSKKALIITFQISLHVALKATAIISNIVRLQSDKDKFQESSSSCLEQQMTV